MKLPEKERGAIWAQIRGKFFFFPFTKNSERLKKEELGEEEESGVGTESRSRIQMLGTGKSQLSKPGFVDFIVYVAFDCVMGISTWL